MKQKYLTMLLSVLMSMVGAKTFAQNIAVKNADGVTIYYIFINNRTELEVFSPSSSIRYVGNVVIPESVTYNGKTYSVTSIGNCAFSDCSGLTSVTIPNSVTSIRSQAFYGCSGLTELAIPNSVTFIDYFAFEGCEGLTKLTMGSSVATIEYGAFDGCSGLESITVEEGNLYYDSRENSNAIIRTADNELVVGCKNTRIPNSVTSIGKYAFSGCSGLTEVTIPNSVTSIGNNAFRKCSGLTELIIPNSVTSIGLGTFWECSGLTSITSLNTTPPNISEIEVGMPTFDLTTYDNATLHVPAGCKEAYRQAVMWWFVNIQDDAPTGIESIRTDKQDNTTVYTLDGKRLNTTNTADLPTGIYIINGKKVAVK